jgi:F-type H+-transporting ATPase subunit b
MNHRTTTRIAVALGVGAFVALVADVAAAADGASHGPDWGQLGASIVNFVIYVGAIVFLGGKGINAFFANRRGDLLKNIEASKSRREAAESELAAHLERLEGFDAEREALLQEFRELGSRERDRIVEEAREAAAKIKADAAVTATVEARRANADLEARLIDRALSGAKAELEKRMDATTRASLIDAGIDAVGTSAPTVH